MAHLKQICASPFRDLESDNTPAESFDWNAGNVTKNPSIPLPTASSACSRSCAPRRLALIVNPQLLALLIQMTPLQPQRPRRLRHAVTMPVQLRLHH